MRDIRTATGKVSITMRAEGRWKRNIAQTMMTIMLSSMSFSFKVATALSMRSDLSYVVTISTPSGRAGFISSILFFTRWMTSYMFSPNLTTTTPPMTSPSPLSSATPRLISGPSVTYPTSRTRTGVPFSYFRTIFSMSVTLLMYPLPLTKYSVPDISMRRPPTSLFERLTLSITSFTGML